MQTIELKAAPKVKNLIKMQSIELKAAPKVKNLINVAFPGYTKRSAFLSAFTSCDINSYWDGGSKATFVLVELATMRVKALPTSSHPYFDPHAANGSNPDITIERGLVTLNRLPEGIALVEAGTFCGKPAIAHVYLNPANFAKVLSSGNNI